MWWSPVFKFCFSSGEVMGESERVGRRMKRCTYKGESYEELRA